MEVGNQGVWYTSKPPSAQSRNTCSTSKETKSPVGTCSNYNSLWICVKQKNKMACHNVKIYPIHTLIHLKGVRNKTQNAAVE